MRPTGWNLHASFFPRKHARISIGCVYEGRGCCGLSLLVEPADFSGCFHSLPHVRSLSSTGPSSDLHHSRTLKRKRTACPGWGLAEETMTMDGGRHVSRTRARRIAGIVIDSLFACLTNQHLSTIYVPTTDRTVRCCQLEANPKHSFTRISSRRPHGHAHGHGQLAIHFRHEHGLRCATLAGRQVGLSPAARPGECLARPGKLCVLWMGSRR
ncbi:hypothetical protein FA95DRAFT_545545 [Auriscalpium vulgare]|uniref:Uncharacterized protein n=1 Tax=Auriscalpium vulgare TaxID=40419 RepID=A0ACB8RFE8_9AGAM|nr:hypothetical protein FA95DRAFT_545545 [Auriscalpium vulgare]